MIPKITILVKMHYQKDYKHISLDMLERLTK